MGIKRSICSIHGEIGKLAAELSDLDFDRSVKSDVKRIAKRMTELAKDASKAGMSMENRMAKYRDTIESLGFKRIK